MKESEMRDRVLYSKLYKRIGYRITKDYKLTKREVQRIVHEWYIFEFLPNNLGVIQDEFGNDLEELVEINFDEYERPNSRKRNKPI